MRRVSRGPSVSDPYIGIYELKLMEHTPEHGGLGAWTELCEICDWNEVAALKTLERFIQAKSPQPTGRARELCTILTSAYAQIKKGLESQLPDC